MYFIKYFFLFFFNFILAPALSIFILYAVYRRKTINKKTKLYIYSWVLILFLWLFSIWIFSMKNFTIKNNQEKLVKFCWYSAEISSKLSKNLEKDTINKLISKCNEKRENYIKYKKEIEENFKVLDIIYWIK